jgi:HlyD family secretion protein
MSRWTRRLLLFAALAAAAVALKLSVFRDEPLPVTVFKAARGRVEDTVTNSKAGSIAARLRASLSPEIGGRVEELPVHKGDRVRAGQVLLRLASRDLEADVVLQERSLEAARAAEKASCLQAEQAERVLRRQRDLAASEIVSPDVLDRAQSDRDIEAADCEEAHLRVAQAGASVEAAKATAAKAVLHAPFDGVVAELRTQVGEWITPAPPGVPIPPVLDLIDPSSIYVSAPLDEVDVGKVRVGLPVRITMDAYPGRAFPGKVVRVAPYVRDVEEQNRTFEIEVEFDDAAFARTLLPGTSADVEVVLQARDDVLRIPSYAVIEGSKALVVRGGRLEEVPVATGLRNWEFVEITSGLGAGDPVVVSLDRAEVKAGARVRIAAETLK